MNQLFTLATEGTHVTLCRSVVAANSVLEPSTTLVAKPENAEAEAIPENQFFTLVAQVVILLIRIHIRRTNLILEPGHHIVCKGLEVCGVHTAEAAVRKSLLHIRSPCNHVGLR